MASIDFNTRIASGASARRQPHLRAIDGAAGAQIPPHSHPPQHSGEAGAQDAPGGGVGRLVQLAGALTSLALIGGLIWWGYELVMRDVNGIPVVRALEGPLRVQPEDPGGELARYQGLSVNRIQAEGNAAPAPDQLVLAPRPVDVIESDPPGISPRPRPAPATRGAIMPPSDATRPDGDAGKASPSAASGPPVAGASAAAGAAAAQADVAPSPAEEAPTPSEIAAAARALAAQVAGENGSDTALSDTALSETELSARTETPAAIPASVPGVRKSPRPAPRPAGLERFAAMVRATGAGAAGAQQAATDIDIDPASLPPRTSLAQLGAFDSPEIARREWERLIARFPDYFAGKQRVIEEATTGGRRFYRLRVHGFADMSDARRFCSVLLAEDAVCIAVMTR